MDIRFYMPTRIVMQDDCVQANADAFRQYGRKALAVTGRTSARKNGALDDVLAALCKNDQTFVLFDEVESNPSVSCVYKGGKVARENAVDFVVGIGGGSPMDAAKAIAVLARQDIPEAELFSGKIGEDALPMVFIPTTAGTGSEVTPYSVLTNHEAKTKMSISAPSMFPQLALLDAKYLERMTRTGTINTGIDALSHAVEGMLSQRATPISDLMAKESIALISSCLERMEAQELTKAEYEKLLYASTLGGMVISHTGTTIVHAMGYPLTYYKNIDHGRANGLLLAAFLRFTARHRPEKVDAVLTAGNFSSLDAFDAAIRNVLGERETLTEEEMQAYAAQSSKAKNAGNCIYVPSQQDVLEMYVHSL